jgi:serine/threonine-protein kinase ATR
VAGGPLLARGAVPAFALAFALALAVAPAPASAVFPAPALAVSPGPALAVVVALALAVAPVPALTVAPVLAFAPAAVDRAPGSATLSAVPPIPAAVAIAPVTSSRPSAAMPAVSRLCPRGHDRRRRGAWDG